MFWLKVFLQSISIIYAYYIIFFSNTEAFYHYPLAFLLGLTYISVGFSALHDASHFALFSVNSPYFGYNDSVCRFLMAMILAKHEMWTYHHIFRHHNDTGGADIDPDTFCFQVYTKKSPRCMLHSYMRFVAKVMKALVFFMIIFFPGILYGQIILYWIYFKEKVIYKWYEAPTLMFGILAHLYR